MNHEEIKALIPAYALGALDSGETEILLRHFAECDSCEKDLEDFRRVAEDLSRAVPQEGPPLRLKQKIMARLEPKRSRLPGFAWNRLALAWAPLSLLLLVGALAAHISLNNELREMREIVGQAPALVLAVNLQGTDMALQAQGKLFALPQKRVALLAVYDLPALPPDQTYQLWLIRDGERDSGGIFTVDSEGKGSLLVEAPQSIGLYQAVGITMEPAGGSPVPTGDRYLFGSL